MLSTVWNYTVLRLEQLRGKKPKLIYLAGPYSHRTKKIMFQREQALTKYAAVMVTQGLHVWSPITESHQYSQIMGLNGSWEFWREHDLLMLSKCDELWVLKLKGWEKSVGVTAEIAAAKEMNKPIVYVEPSDD